MKAAELYDTDFAEWALRNAELLRSGRTGEADLEHIAEEIEDMAKRERDATRRRLARLIQHLLKWQVQPAKRGKSWQSTIVEQRYRISDLLKENPSFRPRMNDWIAEEYDHAVRLATIDTGLERDHFPKAWPYTVEQSLDQDFLPE